MFANPHGVKKLKRCSFARFVQSEEQNFAIFVQLIEQNTIFMIHKEILKEVMLDNRYEVEHQHVVARDYQFEDFANYVLVGVRRAGKSFLLYQQMQKYLREGIGWERMLYINFEDDRLLGMTVDDLNIILEVHASISSERPMLFLDEIQNIEGWESSPAALRTGNTGYISQAVMPRCSVAMSPRLWEGDMLSIMYFHTALRSICAH